MNSSRLPGLREGAKGRNILVGIGYLSVGIILSPVILLLLILSPLILGLCVWRNWFNVAELFRGLPGISETGGVKSGVLVYLYGAAVMSTVLVGLGSLVGDSVESSPNSNLESTSTVPNSGTGMNDESDSVQSAQRATESPTQNMPSYHSVKAEDLDLPDKSRVEISVKLDEPHPELTEEEALLVGKDVVTGRNGEDVIYVQIYHPDGEVGAGACASVKWTKGSGYEIDVFPYSCENPEW